MNDPAKLRADVEALATSDGRQIGTPGHDAAERYLLGRLGQLRLKPYRDNKFELPYESDGQRFCNLVAVVPGTDRTLKPILIGAHYDSVIPSYCADDNAAAVAITLLAAEKVQAMRFRRDTIIALFDAEEPPYFHSDDMGSTRFYLEQRRPEGFHIALIMDLVGHDVEFPLPDSTALSQAAAGLLFMTGAESHEALTEVVKSCLPGPELPLLATLNRNVGDMSDHHAFRLNAVPYLFFSCGQWQHYHQDTDTPDRLNYEKMARICEFLVRLCQKLDGTELPVSDRAQRAESLDNGVADTTAFEVDLMERAFGPALPFFLEAVGMTSLSSRQDLDRLAHGLQGYFRL